ncbi:ethanolamine-phosphate cytidylyltransferase-like [Brassica napus]|uniref:ethanolamine-phosphate cytidylyltransferase-like n=1 Tax=Brassica napus TaxID=3708 RepID=UPI002078F92E|nr:ethanolamine-phosphate cytidylyltransferase-like [Brassica napus]
MTFPFLFSPDPDLLDRFVAPFRKRKPVRVYMDGCFDMMHYGHCNALRMILVKAVKRVDEVIPDAPYAITEEFMKRLFDEYRIDYIIHGDDPCVLPDGTDAYALAKKAGRYKKIKRTEGVSSTDIAGTNFRYGNFDSSSAENGFESYR